MQHNKGLVRRFYEEMWNHWDFQLTNELLNDEFILHGSTGLYKTGRQGFIDYADTVHRVFPDFHSAIDDLIAEENKVVARLSFSGTQQKELFGKAADGRRVYYDGLAIFTFEKEKISELWLISDLYNLMMQVKSKYG
ncbi:MAG: ester cyclase [Gammaproteobacteria bacterium]|nr:ester cyclase [Gammaproteobacteria bacterium]